MSSPNEDPKPMDNMELLKQQASTCGAGCGCHSPGSLGPRRWLLGAIVLFAAAGLVARAVIKDHRASPEPIARAFAPLAAAPTADGVSSASPDETAGVTTASVGKSIASLAELNTAAAASDAVFVYVPAKDGAAVDPPSAAMKSAASRIESQGYKVALFTLETGSHDHEQLAAQMSVPGVLALVKGRGMSPVSGEITEAKLIQGFVAAGNCGPGSGGSGACCPPGSH